MNYQPMLCPNCRNVLWIHKAGIRSAILLLIVSAFNVRFFCPSCDKRLCISAEYTRWTLLLIFVLIVPVAWATKTPESSGAWLLGLLVAALIVRMAFIALIPPPLLVAKKGEGIPFAACYVGLALTIVIQQFIVIGWVIVILGGAKRDLYEHFEMLSTPLSWINQNFLITPSRSIVDVCGILLGNSYFAAFATWACANTVHAVFLRNRVTQLGITDSKVELDD